MAQTDALQLSWPTQALWAALDPLLPGVAVEIMSRVESTNSALVDRARLSAGQRAALSGRVAATPAAAPAPIPLGRRSMDSQPCLLVAENQTRGRGRMGRVWSSSPGASLTFSLALPLSPVDWSGLSLAVGVALADALEPPRDGQQPARLRLKWPNDLWLSDASQPRGGRKLGGILIETVPVGGRRMCVIGVGLNVLPQQFDDLASGYACLQELWPDVTAPAALLAVAPAVVRAMLSFETQGFARFAERYAARDGLAGRRLMTSQSGALEGTAEGVDERGALRLLCDDGRRLLISSGEVSVRPVASAAGCP
jgi:BirA family transcriptional regulator, biotin operon repressor / biotin---[acetyl-CoA-carboxylase] ligase